MGFVSLFSPTPGIVVLSAQHGTDGRAWSSENLVSNSQVNKDALTKCQLVVILHPRDSVTTNIKNSRNVIHNNPGLQIE